MEAYGCSANIAEAEMTRGLLREAGYTLADSPENADLNIVVTCTVKTPTQNKIIKRIKKLSASSKPLVVAGCMPKAQRDLVADTVPDASLIGPDDFNKVVYAVECALEGIRVEEVSGLPFDRTCLPRIRVRPLIHIAPTSTGCLGNCSYCIVKRARGHLYSYPADGLVDDAKAAVTEGCRELWITAEDTAAYRWEDFRLPGLLEGICNIEGSFYVRVGMMTPNQAWEIFNDLAEAYRHPKMFKFLHVPVQAGNDEVLGWMRRKYTVDDFRKLVSEFREAVPGLTVSTDVICGFPGESEEQFMDTVSLMEEIEPDVLNISRFWSRPGTDAASLPGQLHGRETKERSRVMSRVFKGISLKKNREWIGWTGPVLIDERGKPGSMMGRNPSYKPVVIKRELSLGDLVDVKIVDAKPSYLVGALV